MQLVEVRIGAYLILASSFFFPLASFFSPLASVLSFVFGPLGEMRGYKIVQNRRPDGGREEKQQMDPSRHHVYLPRYLPTSLLYGMCVGAAACVLLFG